MTSPDYSANGKCQLAVTVFEGRNFPRRPGQQLYVQCEFIKEILATDPVGFEPCPIWDTELDWNLDVRTLHYYKSQRASIKLTCFAVDANACRESIGFFTLDIRGARETPASDHWRPLINPKSSLPFRPEIRYSFSATFKEQLLNAIPFAIATEGDQSVKAVYQERWTSSSASSGASESERALRIRIRETSSQPI